MAYVTEQVLKTYFCFPVQDVDRVGSPVDEVNRGNNHVQPEKPPPPVSISKEHKHVKHCTSLSLSNMCSISRISPSWARAGCKKNLCLLHYPRKIKFIHSLSLSLSISLPQLFVFLFEIVSVRCRVCHLGQICKKADLCLNLYPCVIKYYLLSLSLSPPPPPPFFPALCPFLLPHCKPF